MTDLADLWDNAPCGYLVAQLDGRILDANSTMVRWLGFERDAMRDKSIFDLLTAGGRIHYETHFGPLLRMSGELGGVTLDMVTVDGRRLPMFVTANMKTNADGQPELLRITVLDAADRRAYERELLEQRRRAETDSRRVQAFAETLRRSLLPPVLSPPPGAEAADYYCVASLDEVGGDFYDLFPLSRTTWGFFLGDVAGKGVEAAVVTGLTRYVLRSAAVSVDDPVEVLHNLNSVLLQRPDLEHQRMCTLIYGNVTPNAGGLDVKLASGGHPPPLLLTGDGHAYYADTVGGMAVGMTPDPHFLTNEFRLAPGDTMLLYTDGLTEARTGVGAHRYDDEGALLAFARKHAPASASSIVDAVRGLLDQMGEGCEDDTALLALGVPTAAGESPEA